jgi:23S rRNA (cytosine1962-C5)-methyltransferase
MTTPALVLAPGRERSLERRHPWVFNGSVAEVLGGPGPGEPVAVRAADGRFLAWAAYSPASQISARACSWVEDERIDEAFLERRVHRAVAARSYLDHRTDAVRLVFAESDGLPGVIVDRYGPFVVLQLSSAGAERWREPLTAVCGALPGDEGVYERSDVDARKREGLPPRRGVLAGAEPSADLLLHERAAWSEEDAGARSWSFGADVRHGHKTGFYLDQRASRRVVATLAAGRRTLDLFAYTGGFGVAAASGGASDVTCVDSSAPALSAARENLIRNGVTAQLVEADVFRYLRELRDRGERFDLVVADPPRLVSRAQDVNRGSRAYKDVNLLALKLLAPGGLLVTFSCSGLVGPDLFQKIVFGAALDARREVQVVGRLTQASDHPVLLSFPEGAYLKGLICRAA